MDLSEGSAASERRAVCIKERHLLSPCCVAPAAHIYDEILHDDFYRTRNARRGGMPRDPASYLKVPGHIIGLEAVGLTEYLGGFTHLHWGTRWRSWLKHCSTRRKVAGSIPDGVIGIFHWHNPSGCTMALRSTQPLTEMSTKNISWGKCGRCVGLTTLPPSCDDCLGVWKLQPPGTLRSCPGL